jgi:hypothetical protein
MPIGLLDARNSSRTFDAGNKVAIEFSSIAFPPTNQFGISVLATPLNADGTYQSTLAAPEWYTLVPYSSGPTGGGGKSQLVIQANAPSSPLFRWTVSIPPQQSAHGNALSNMAEIFVPGR